MRRIDLTDAEWVAYADRVDAGSIREWVRLQFGRGLDYYRNRICRLGMGGARVLDAGCGVGAWTLALAEVFDEVHALEIDRERLAVLEGLVSRSKTPIIARHGSVEALPYADAEFDCVFCSGVIFVVDYRKALQEFVRVLRPNGRLYLSFVGLDWWIHLLHDRSASDPACRVYGANGLINLLFRRLDEIRFEHVAAKLARMQARRLLLGGLGTGGSWRARLQLGATLERLDTSAVGDVAGKDLARGVIAVALEELRSMVSDSANRSRAAQARVCLENLVDADVTYLRRVAKDLLSRLLLMKPCHAFDIHTYSFEPEDMSDLLRQMGYRNIVVGWEGGMQIDQSVPRVKPLYEPWQGVYELLAFAPLHSSAENALPVRLLQGKTGASRS